MSGTQTFDLREERLVSPVLLPVFLALLIAAAAIVQR